MGLPIGEPIPPLVIVAIDDDPGILGFYRAVLSGMGVRFESSTDPWQTLDLIKAFDPNLVILDLTMPGIDGMELLRRIKSRDPQMRVVMITGSYTIETAVKAIQEGAIDYVCKPVTSQKLREIATRVQNLVAQEERTRALERELADVSHLEGVIGRSPRMMEVFDLMQSVAPHFRTALIVGEQGSGRRTVARALHSLSPGKDQGFAVFKSEAVAEPPADQTSSPQPSSVILGAVVGEQALFEGAAGGTVFFDEVGDLSPSTQVKLIRLLDRLEANEQSVQPAAQESLRVIASTCRDLEKATRTGRFRPDLWYRLSLVQIHLPPLRDRAEDALLLARHFLSQFSAQYGKPIRRISRGAEAALLSYSWPGNVYELESVIGRACMLAEGNILDCGDLPAGVVLPGYGADLLAHDASAPRSQAGDKPSSTETLRQRVRDILER